MKTQAEQIQDRDEEIARLEKLLLECSDYGKCERCEKVFHVNETDMSFYQEGRCVCDGCAERVRRLDSIEAEASEDVNYSFNNR